ncbi:MAG: hypothetical protein ACRDHN_01595, partial [Thermomicrobiales bacterium]
RLLNFAFDREQITKIIGNRLLRFGQCIGHKNLPSSAEQQTLGGVCSGVMHAPCHRAYRCNLSDDR